MTILLLFKTTIENTTGKYWSCMEQVAVIASYPISQLDNGASHRELYPFSRKSGINNLGGLVTVSKMSASVMKIFIYLLLSRKSQWRTILHKSDCRTT